MKLATIVLTSEGNYQWEGSLRDFFYANDYSRSERRGLCQRIREDMSGDRPSPTTEGGGAAGAFEICITEYPTMNSNLPPGTTDFDIQEHAEGGDFGRALSALADLCTSRRRHTNMTEADHWRLTLLLREYGIAEIIETAILIGE